MNQKNHKEGLHIIPGMILGPSQPPPGHRDPPHWPRHTQQLLLPSLSPGKAGNPPQQPWAAKCPLPGGDHGLGGLRSWPSTDHGLEGSPELLLQHIWHFPALWHPHRMLNICTATRECSLKFQQSSLVTFGNAAKENKCWCPHWEPRQALFHVSRAGQMS